MRYLNWGAAFSGIESGRAGKSLRLLLLAYITVLAYPFHVCPLTSGLDPSWVFGLNHFVNSGIVFGKDVFFTYGPLGFIIFPQEIGANLTIALIAHLIAWSLFAALLLFGSFKKFFSLNQLFLFAIVMIPCGAVSFDLFVSFLVLFLLCFSLYMRNWLPCYLLAIVLTTALFFMKISSALFAVSAVLALSSIQVLKDREQGLPRLGLSLVLIPALFAGAYLLYNPSPADMLAYLGASVEVSSGYSVAMSLVGKWYEIYLALVVIAAYLYFSFLLRRAGEILFLASAAFIFPLFLAFKLGFVRQDGHVVAFFITALFILGLLMLFSQLRGWRETIVFSIVLLACVFVYNQHYKAIFLDRIFPTANINKIINTFNPRPPDKTLSLGNQKLPEDILARIGRSSVGIFPWEISYIAANDLNYSPFPVFQTYSAYTSFLDTLNAAHLNGDKAPQWMLMNFSAIDGRHCLIDVPATWLALYNWYEPAYSTESLLVLSRRKARRFGKPEPVGAAEHRISTVIPIPESAGPMLITIPLDLTFAGKLKKTFYKILPLEMALTDDTGRVYIYRIVPDTLRNGIFINHVPLRMDEIESLFNGSAFRKFVSLQLLGGDLDLYKQQTTVEFLEVPGINISRIDESSMAIFPADIPKSAGTTLYFIDSINIDFINKDKKAFKKKSKTLSTNEPFLRISGWAVDAEAKNASGGIWVEIDGNAYPAIYGAQRPDVAKHYGYPSYEYSGFTFNFPIPSLDPGFHPLSMKILAHDKKSYYQSEEIILKIEGISKP